MCTKLGRLTQGYKDTARIDTIFFLTHEEIKNIPKDCVVTYARIMVDYHPQKSDPNRVRLTVGGNFIVYPGELTTNTADLITTKILLNSVISTLLEKFMTIDIKNMYLQTPLDRYEYMCIPVDLVPQEFIDAYNLCNKIYKGFLYVKIHKGIYGLPQAGILAKKVLRAKVQPHGYYKTSSPSLWTHTTRPI